MTPTPAAMSRAPTVYELNHGRTAYRPPPRLQSAEPAPVVFRVAVSERGLGRHELHDGRGQRRHAQASPAQTRRAALFVARVLPTKASRFSAQIFRVKPLYGPVVARVPAVTLEN